MKIKGQMLKIFVWNKSYGYRVVSREAQGGLHLVIQLSFFEKKFLFTFGWAGSLLLYTGFL